MPRPFASAGTETHYAPDRPVEVTHLRLELELDLEGRRLAGRSVLSLTARRDQVKAVVLDAMGMDIRAATVDGRAAGFDYDGERLRIELGRAFARDDRFTVVVDYRAAPRRGLYFVGPDDTHPDRPLHCWTQGQDEDARHTFPCVDAPGAKATTELLCTAPAGAFVLSNGDLEARESLPDGRTRWHYALEVPHSPYLVTLVCGPFTEIRERAPRTGVDVYYYCLPGHEENTRRTLARTPDMIDYFSERIGLPYPHRRYSQIVVGDFIFGGMENTTATTLTDQTLIDQRAALDHDAEALVAHELAHQWWGNLLTCREWPEAWLNEGFATYFEYVWYERSKSRDEADVHLLADAESYLAEAGRYQRAIVCRQYQEPIELFDSHLYEKGGRVLHMLRHELGDEVFWRALALYAKRHAHGSVETRDLARAVEAASGWNPDRFFDQWVTSAGHPELEGSWSWDDERSVGTLRLSQNQAGDKVYVFDALVRFEVGAEEKDETVAVRERSHAFEIRLPAKPRQVIFDPGDVILKTIKLEKPRPLWTRQLEGARLGIDRILAARALGEKPEPASVEALRAALESDRFWAVRAAAATALGKTRRSDAEQALLAARHQPHPRVRRAVAAALGEMRGSETAAAALASWLEAGDPSCFVEANAALALGRTRSSRAVAVLASALDRPSFQDVIRARSLDGLGACGHEEALTVVQERYRPSSSFQVRRAALAAITRLSEGTLHARRSRELLEAALSDRDFRVRMEAAAGLGSLQDPRAIPPLEHALAAELDGRARRRLREAILELRERGKPPEKLRKLEEDVERLRGESAKLRERLEKLETREPPRPPRRRAPRPAPKPRPQRRSGRRGNRS